MTNAKNTKRALLSSVMALFLCFAMLLGTTYAWFTDSVTSANNIIQSGNLDIELYYQVEGQTDWTKVTDSTNVFKENALWEPGHTEVVKLKVVNEGSLALKYQLGVNVASETGSVNVLGEEFKLSDFIKFGIVEGEQTYTRDEAIAAVDATATALNTAYNSGTVKLLPKTDENTDNEDIVTMVVYMPTNVGNDANHAKDAAVPTINLGINLFATQVESESDSFGNNYDEDAWMNGMWVYDAAQLNTAIAEVEDGGTIILADDVTFDEDSCVNSGGSWYEGLYYVGDKSFTINLNGNKITNDSAINDYLMLFKNDGSKENVINIKNGTLEASSSAYCAICTSTASTQKITINLENVTLVGNNSNGSVAKIRGGAELNVKAGTVITGNDSYLGIESYNGIVNIYDGAEIYQKGSSSYNGSLVGVGGNGTVNVYGGYGEGVSGGFIAMTSGGTINVYGGEWMANSNGAYANGNKSVLIAQSAGGAASIINVYGGEFFGGYNCYGDAVGDAQINVAGGIFNADPSAYIADGYKAVSVGERYEVVEDVVNYATASTADELQTALDNAANQNLIVLTADITGDVKVKQIDNLVITVNGDGHEFAGVFLVDGNSATETTSGVTLKNIKFKADSISADACVRLGDGTSATRYTCNVTVDNCTFDVPGAVGVKSYTGGDKNLKVVGCTASSVMHSLVQVAGVDGVLIDDCEVYSKNGVNFNQSNNVTIRASKFDVTGYAVRFGASSGTTGIAEIYLIEGCELKSACDGGDSVIILRGTAESATLTIVNTTLTGTSQIANNANATVNK